MANKRVVITGAVIVLVIIGGALLSIQLPSGPSDVRDGPGMLYFYAVW